MANVPKGQSCKNCARKNDCETKKVAVWCVWYKPDNGKKQDMVGESYMKIADSFERKKCGYLENHVCPLRPSKARKGESCDGCSLLEKIISFKALSLEIEEHDRKI